MNSVQNPPVYRMPQAAAVNFISFADDPDVRSIISSTYFQKAMRQKHHGRTSVGIHMIHVAIISLRISALLSAVGIRLDNKALYLCSLCHDLGILGRYDGAFTSGYETCFYHPLRSIPVMEEILGDVPDSYKGIVASHMWPLSFRAPHSMEAFVLTIADKFCAFTEAVEPKRWTLKTWAATE